MQVLAGPSTKHRPVKWDVVTPAHNTKCGEPCTNTTVKSEFYVVQNTLSPFSAVKSGPRRRPDAKSAMQYAGTALSNAKWTSRVQRSECPRHRLLIRLVRPSLTTTFRHAQLKAITHYALPGLRSIICIWCANADQHGRLRLGVHWPFGHWVRIIILSQFQPSALLSRNQHIMYGYIMTTTDFGNNALMTRTDMFLEASVYSPFNHLTPLLVR